MLLAWHSWRKPGKPPFQGGDVCNVWMCVEKKGGWSPSFQPLPTLSDTNYPAVVFGRDKRYWMSFVLRENSSLGLANSVDGIDWNMVSKGIFDFPVTNADSTVDSEGRLWLAVVGKRKNQNELLITSSRDGKKWEKPATPFEFGKRPARPRISCDETGRLWLAWHSDYWDSVELECSIEVKGGKLEQTVFCDGSPGNHCWAWNGVEIKWVCRGQERNLRFEFGISPQEKEAESKEATPIRLTPSNCLYDKAKGYGFDYPVEGMRRSKGEGVTKELFYSCSKRTFSVDLPNGHYRVKNWLSSWLVARKQATLEVNRGEKVFRPSEINHGKEEVFVSHCEKNGKWSKAVSLPFEGYEANRPSKIVESGSGKCRLFWTGVDKNGVSVWTRELSLRGSDE